MAVNAFPAGRGRIPDNPVIAASVAALFNGGGRARQLSGGWWPDDAGCLTYRYIDRAGNDVVVSLDPDVAAPGAGAQGLAGQWSAVEGMSPLTIDVLLAVLAQISAAADGTRGTPRPTVAITARTILRCKGLAQWGAEGAALRRRVDAEVLRLQALRLTARAGAMAAFPGADRLFEIVESRPAGMIRRSADRRPETIWLLRPGRWARRETAVEDRPPFAALPRALLQLDHRANRGSDVLAKKLGVRAALLWGGPLPAGPLRRRVYNLLAELGELPRPACRGGGWAAGMRLRLHRAIRSLQDAGLLGEVAWPAGFEPDCRTQAKGWVSSWLNGTIVLSGPAVYGEGAGSPRRGTRRAGKKTSKLAALPRGSVIRAMRTDRNVPQSRLARELGISASYLSQIENEHRLASPAVLGRVACWVARHRAGEAESVGGDGAIAAIGPAGGHLELTDIGHGAGKDDRT